MNGNNNQEDPLAFLDQGDQYWLPSLLIVIALFAGGASFASNWFIGIKILCIVGFIIGVVWYIILVIKDVRKEKKSGEARK